MNKPGSGKQPQGLPQKWTRNVVEVPFEFTSLTYQLYSIWAPSVLRGNADLSEILQTQVDIDRAQLPAIATRRTPYLSTALRRACACLLRASRTWVYLKA